MTIYNINNNNNFRHTESRTQLHQLIETKIEMVIYF
jgi:hypothetical protein